LKAEDNGRQGRKRAHSLHAIYTALKGPLFHGRATFMGLGTNIREILHRKNQLGASGFLLSQRGRAAD
jgi:hypothetical protein